MMLTRIAAPLLLTLSIASMGNAQASAPQGGQSANDREQARLDQKFGRAPEGRWWDEQGRLCRTDRVNGKAIRRCEMPSTDTANSQAQERLDRKFGRAPAGRWWDEQGRLCRTDRVGSKDVRRCEDPRPGQVTPYRT